MDHGREVHQECITDSFDDVTVMSSHRLLKEVIMDIEQAQHAGLRRAHLATKADDVGEHDRRQPPSLHLRCAAGIIHRPGLFCWRCLTVN